VQQRKRTRPLSAYDPARVPKDTLDKIESGEVQSFVPVPGYTSNDAPIAEIRRAQFPRENFTFNDYAERDINAAWAIDANQQGTATNTKRTATELSLINSATQTRMERERTQVSRWFVSGVQKLASLIQLFADDPDYVEIVGPDGLRRLQSWDKTTIQGRFAFSAKPDSSLRLDASFDKKQAMDEYQFFRKDPMVNPAYLLQRTARRLQMDPAQFVAQPQPPKPPEPTLGFSFKGDDLNPMTPQYAAVYAILQVTQPQVAQMLPPPLPPMLTQQMPMSPDQEHKGTAPEVSPLSKHKADASGALPGMGQAGQPAGGVQ
jgi:hypothetical protein